MLALLFPTVVLLSAVATLIGAGAHLITVSLLLERTGERIGFVEWLVLGLPLAVVASHLAAETVLLTTTRRADRREPVRITVARLQEHSPTPVSGPLTTAETRCLLLLGTVGTDPGPSLSRTVPSAGEEATTAPLRATTAGDTPCRGSAHHGPARGRRAARARPGPRWRGRRRRSPPGPRWSDGPAAVRYGPR